MDTTARITRLVLPGLTNRYGSLFGGVALSLMDEAAAIVATRVARGGTAPRGTRTTRCPWRSRAC